MGLIKLITQVLKDNVCSAAVVSRRISSRVVLDSTMESDKKLSQYGGVEKILESFDRVELLERRIFGYYNSEDYPSIDSSVTTEQKQGDKSND